LVRLATATFPKIQPQVKRKQPFPLTRVFAPVFGSFRGGLSINPNGGTMSFEPLCANHTPFFPGMEPEGDLRFGQKLGAAQVFDMQRQHVFEASVPWRVPVAFDESLVAVRHARTLPLRRVGFPHAGRFRDDRLRDGLHAQSTVSGNGRALLLPENTL
jgi:hypothetical protein